MRSQAPQHLSTVPAHQRGTTAAWFVTTLIAALVCSPLDAQILDRLRQLGGNDDSAREQAVDTGEIGRGLREALTVGTANVVDRLGQPGGFDLDPSIHIPLPSQLGKVQNALQVVGMDGLLSDLETRMNNAAESATPKARALFLDAIAAMTLDDVMAIYQGPDDAATQYFRAQMSDPLAAEMTPIVDAALSEAGAVQAYDRALGRYASLPLASSVDVDLTGYVVNKGMDGIFYYLAREEAAIRRDPAKRSTELLQKVFGSQP